MYIYIYIYIYIDTYICISLYIHIYIYIYMYVSLSLYIYIYIYICMYNIYIYIYMYTYIQRELYRYLRTNGVNTHGAVAKVMNSDRLGKKVRPGTFGKTRSRLTGVPQKVPLSKIMKFAVTPFGYSLQGGCSGRGCSGWG